MQDIERFTKQNIEVKLIEGFGPEPGERAEPLAMGRQTIWGGLGKPPSREVMQAAAKAARTEMLQRVRENKAGQGGRGAQGAGRGNGGGNGGGNGARSSQGPRGEQAPRPQGARPPQGQGRGRSPMGGNGGGNGGGYGGEPRAPQGQPDPMRTSVDMMADRGARRGGNRNGGGSRAGGFGGGGNGNRGSGNPRGPFSR
jgi:ATP-dependent RNA helicase RhlE